jgi:hypothetical protein
VEDIVIDGTSVSAETSSEDVCAYGQELNGEMVFNVGDYSGKAKKASVSFPVKSEKRVIDLRSGEELATVTPEKNTVSFVFGERRYYTVHIK